MHMPPSCVRSVSQPTTITVLFQSFRTWMARTPRDTYSLRLWDWLTKFSLDYAIRSLRLFLLWRETSQEHKSFKCCLFYSLLSCWVRTRVVAISLMKLTFPAACFLHVKNSCNWRNYLGQKLRVNTNLSSAYFVNIFQVQVHSSIQIAKVIRRLANATTICIPEKRTHPSRLFFANRAKKCRRLI